MCIRDSPQSVQNPFRVMKLWLKWETMDIQAMIEAIEARSELEGRRLQIVQRRTGKQKELDKLKAGKKGFT